MTATPTMAAASIRLELPDMTWAASYLEARREGYRDTTQLGQDEGNGPTEANIAEHIARLNAPRGDVPRAHLWMASGIDFVGRVTIRYVLDEALRRSGGHIGYEVRPSLRGQGLGHRALALGIEHLAAHGIVECLLTCRDDNAASARVIERAGGRLDGIGPHPERPGELMRRYWIRPR